MREGLARDRAAMSAEGGEEPRSPDRLGFTGSHDDGAGRFAFATSLSKMRAAAAAEQAAKQASVPSGAMGLGAGSPKSPAAPSRFDAWAEGFFSYFTNDHPDGRQQGHAGIAFFGADYLVMPGLIVGGMVQFDTVEQSTARGIGNASGHGWMAGPYVSASLTSKIYFDARALWGRSSNDIDPLGAYVDSFATSRHLVAAKLTGQWTAGALTFKPSAQLTYFAEQQEAYVNAIGIAIDSHTVRLGQLKLGPEFSYRMAVGETGSFEPFFGIKGVWDFARTGETTAAGEPVGGGPFHARIEAGAALRLPSGIAIRGEGAYDGIGSDTFKAWQGRATIVVPLQ